MKKMIPFQIGKSGITDGVIESLTLGLKHHNQVRISVLKASGRNRDTIKPMAEEIVSKLTDKCDFRVIGFTIILVKIPTKTPAPRRLPTRRK